MRCLEIQDFLCDVSSFTLRDDLEIDFVIKLNAIEHMKKIFNDIKLLNFNSIRATQQAFDNLSLRPSIINVVLNMQSEKHKDFK